MGLDFDITAPPPDTKSIAAIRAEFAAEHLRLRELNKRFLIVAVTVTVAILCFVLFVAIPLATTPGNEGSIEFVIVYTIPYFFFSIFVVGNTMHNSRVEVPQKALKIAEAALEDGEQEDIGALLEACQTHAPLGAYLKQVESQERALFQGEIDAMQRWLEEQTRQTQQS